MKRIEVNVQTGERTVVALTPQEIAEAQIRGQQELARKVARTAAFKSRPIEEKLAALGITLAELKAELAKI